MVFRTDLQRSISATYASCDLLDVSRRRISIGTGFWCKIGYIMLLAVVVDCVTTELIGVVILVVAG